MLNSKKNKPTELWKDLANYHKKVLNNEWYKILTKIESGFVEATFLFYKNKGINFLPLPITTGSISSPIGLGSDSSPVEIDMFGKKIYLADSMQFFLEFFCRINKNGCYYISPSFRGENADKRHLCQFIHSEVEIVGNIDDVIKLAEEYLNFLCVYFLDNYKEEILSVCDNLDHIKKYIKLSNIKRCTFNEAVDILGYKKEFFEDCGKYRKITHLGEKKLIEYFDGFVWLTNFDYLSVPFYQKSKNNNKEAVNADLLMGIGETVGLGERHFTDLDVEKALTIHGVSKNKYKWYLDMKKTKLQTSGFGMGMERFLMWLLKQDDIRNLQLVPRFNGKDVIF